MLKFFRRIRQKLIEDGNLKRYLIYAIGEILLVVMGILIALQINNWNNKKNQEGQFSGLVEQIYNSVYTDTEIHLTNRKELNFQIGLINQLIENSDSISDNNLLPILFYIDKYIQTNAYSRAENLIPFLDYKSSNSEHQEIIRQISSFSSSNPFSYDANEALLKEIVSPILTREGLPKPNMIFILTADMGFNMGGFFELDDIKKGREILKTKEFRSALKTLQSNKWGVINFINNDLEGGLSILKLIEEYKPDVQLLFDDVGIIGDALETGWTKSMPLNLVEGKDCIWEIDIKLKQGEVKFRNRDSWSENWGGESFPNGRLEYYGNNIRIADEGNYKVKINLTDKSYSFIKQ